jgi:hypothetical protein
MKLNSELFTNKSRDKAIKELAAVGCITDNWRQSYKGYFLLKKDTICIKVFVVELPQFRLK